MLSKVSAITGVDNSSLGISSNFNIEKVVIGFFVYVLKLENLDQDGNQILDKNGEPVYNWYVGETRNPFKRWDEHIDSISFSKKMEDEFPETKEKSPGYDEEFLKKLYSKRNEMGPKAFSREFIQRLAFGGEPRIESHKRNQRFLSFLKKEGASEILKTSGSVWASKHKPISVHYLEEISSKYFDPNYVKDGNLGEVTDKELYDEMLKREKDLTLIFAERYGRENVRGSSWASLKIRPPKNPDFEQSSPINPWDFIPPSERSEYSEYFEKITPQQNLPKTEGINSIFRDYEKSRASEIAEKLRVDHLDIWESIKERKVVPNNVVDIFPDVNQKIWNHILKIKFPKETSKSNRATKAGRPGREDHLKYNRRSIITLLKNIKYGKPGLHLINYLKALPSKKISEISGIPERHIEGLKLKALFERGSGSLGQMFEATYPQEDFPYEEEIFVPEKQKYLGEIKMFDEKDNLFANAPEAITGLSASGSYEEGSRLLSIKKFFKIASTRYIAAINDTDANKSGMITMIQQALVDLGYPLEADGNYGDETAEAVLAFRDINGLSEGFSVDYPTFKKLFSIDAKSFDNISRASKLMRLMQVSLESSDEDGDEESFSDEGSSVSESSLYSDLMASLGNRNLCIAMVANAIHESALNPDIAGDCGEYARSEKRRHRSLRIREKGLCCSFGLWQLNICGGLGITFLEENGNPSSKREKRELLSDYNKQLNFMTSYLKSRYSSIIREERTVGEWTEWFVREIERPADPDGAVSKRSATADRLDREIAYA